MPREACPECWPYNRTEVGETVKFALSEEEIPTSWVNLLADLPGRAAAAAHPGHGEPVGPDDLAAALPDGADRAGGLDRARHRDPGGGPGRSTASGGRPRCFAPGGSSARSIPRRTSTTSTRGSPRPARTSPTPRSPRPSTTARPGSASSPPRPGRGSGAPRSRSPASCSGSSARSSWSASPTTRSPTAGR